MNKILKFIASLAVPFIAGAIGSLATFPNISSWYMSLEKPFFNPPNWLFGPVWTILYVFMGISLYLFWTSTSKGDKTKAFIAFGVQITLNTLWSVFFFGLHSPVGGLIIILGLLVALAMTIRYFWKFSKVGSYLLVPYLLWTTFATVLNISIVVLN
jgi:benzodiazapine receptor